MSAHAQLFSRQPRSRVICEQYGLWMKAHQGQSGVLPSIEGKCPDQNMKSRVVWE